ncbi:hypothetical protein M5K25_006681 [Dendrobium thyrsiflorum]|uniref:Uncharacterized protein n=1 Tax=Dendrobium thyrsiflorum TaxID=117978 RepID=A0ABD0VJ30_DENTH
MDQQQQQHAKNRAWLSFCDVKRWSKSVHKIALKSAQDQDDVLIGQANQAIFNHPGAFQLDVLCNVLCRLQVEAKGVKVLCRLQEEAKGVQQRRPGLTQYYVFHCGCQAHDAHPGCHSKLRSALAEPPFAGFGIQRRLKGEQSCRTIQFSLLEFDRDEFTNGSKAKPFLCSAECHDLLSELDYGCK